MSSPDTEIISILGVNAGAELKGQRVGSKSLPRQLPVLGLSDIVIYPGMIAPLLVDSASSIRLIDDVVAGDRLVGLVLQRDPDIDLPKPEELWEHGCAARILKMLKFPDHTVRVLVEGLLRIGIKRFKSQDPYLVASIEILRDQEEDSLEMTAMTRNAQQQFEKIIELSPGMSDEVKIAALNSETSGKLTDLIAANLNLSLEERQQLLEAFVVKDRLSLLLPWLNRELEVQMLGSKIQKEVASSMSKNQRDFFLREQMRAIQRELGEGDTTNRDLEQFKDALSKNEYPKEVREVAQREMDRLQQIPPSVAEYNVARTYLEWLVNLPWEKSTPDKFDLKQAAAILSEHHYGLAKVKDRLLEFIAVLKLQNKHRGPILCLAGPPGVGKTSLGQSIADALGRQFVRIALGGMRDEAEIRGHRRTYVGALPGRIIQGIRRVGSNNPVILLDEIDKVGSDFRGDPSSALLEVLDPRQNCNFTDNYLELPFDLSSVLFLTTANWLEPLDSALRDRLEILELPGYTATEKMQIAKRHLIPRQFSEHGVKSSWVRLSDATLRRVIQDYTREAGVRQLEREIASLSRKVIRRRVENNGAGKPLVITSKRLEDYLGKPRIIRENAETIRECGIAIGLAWTPVGGEILFIEATRMPGKGRLSLTGSMGEVMKESAQTALSYLRSQAPEWEEQFRHMSEWDIHIHIPAGAVPKDGPSAGLVITTALASLFVGRKVRSQTAMTGEISLRGRVLPVGGIKEKVMAAARSGIKELILPEQNRLDWDEVPEEIQRRIKVYFISQMADVFPLALRSK